VTDRLFVPESVSHGATI